MISGSRIPRRFYAASVGFSIVGLWMYRRTQYNKKYTHLTDHIIDSTGVNTLVNQNVINPPIEFVYDDSDKKLSFNKLKILTELIKSSLIELTTIDNSDELGDLVLLLCRKQSMKQQVAEQLARCLKSPGKLQILFVSIYPDGPSNVADRFQLCLNYLKGDPKWLDSFAETVKILHCWINALGNQFCPTTNQPLLSHPILILSDKTLVQCALDKVSVHDGSVRFYVRKDASTSKFSLWQPSTWFDVASDDGEWTEWEIFDKLSVYSDSYGSLKIDMDDHVINCIKCEFQNCSYTLDDEAIKKKINKNDFACESVNPKLLPSIILLN